MKEQTKFQIIKEDDESIDEFMDRLHDMINGPKYKAKIDTLWEECFRPTVKYGRELEYDSEDYMSFKGAREISLGKNEGEDVTLHTIESEILHAIYKRISAHFEEDN